MLIGKRRSTLSILRSRLFASRSLSHRCRISCLHPMKTPTATVRACSPRPLLNKLHQALHLTFRERREEREARARRGQAVQEDREGRAWSSLKANIIGETRLLLICRSKKIFHSNRADSLAKSNIWRLSYKLFSLKRTSKKSLSNSISCKSQLLRHWSRNRIRNSRLLFRHFSSNLIFRASSRYLTMQPPLKTAALLSRTNRAASGKSPPRWSSKILSQKMMKWKRTMTTSKKRTKTSQLVSI